MLHSIDCEMKVSKRGVRVRLAPGIVLGIINGWCGCSMNLPDFFPIVHLAKS